MTRWLLLLIACVAPSVAGAQVISATGGATTISGAQGAMTSVYFDNSQTNIGLGFVQGKPILGISEKTEIDGFDVVGGDTILPASLPSDFGEGQFGFNGRGLSVERDLLGEKLFAFAGVSSQFFAYPMTYGSRMNGRPTGVLSYERTLSDRWTFDSYEFVSDKQTAIQSLSWHAGDGLRISGSAGIGGNAFYSGVVADLREKYLAFRVGYARSNPSFRLVTAPNTYIASNTGLNATASVTPYKWLALTASQFGGQSPASVGQNSLHIRTDNAGVSIGTNRFNLTASGYAGRVQGQPTAFAQSYGGGFQAFRNVLQVQSSYSSSAYGRGVYTTVTEHLSRKLSISQYIHTTSQNTTVNVGGAYTSNSLSVSLGWAQEFQPGTQGQDPFRSVLTASVTLRVKGAQVSTDMIVYPGERPLYSAAAGDYFYGGIPVGSGPSGGHHKTGKYAVTVLVLDEDGQPVQGAAIRINKDIVWTNAQGILQISRKKPEAIAVVVLPEEFMGFGKWVVVEAPKEITATPATNPTPIKIIVALQQ